ncbi:MAG: dual specificity protein phosphatase family protein [Anaerolineales bacterium]|nr:dual specificity protein phosphatase family protein [Anaerolineales bacterium]
MNASQITRALYIGTTPSAQDYDSLREMGVRLVINLRVEHPPPADRNQLPLKILWLPVFDTPLLPIPMNMLRRGVRAALQTLSEGGAVYAHCAAGVHRAPAMGAAILIAQGYALEEALRLVKQQRPIADPYAWYIRRRIERFAKIWDGGGAQSEA